MTIITNLLKAILYECCEPSHERIISDSKAFQDAEKMALEDLQAYAQKDPASSQDLTILAQTSTSYSAVLHYRLAHSLIQEPINALDAEVENYAHLISCRGKLKSGAEIHFKAEIGKRFVLDHGYGTVIGETTRMGDDCYVLGGVILGARGISDNPNGNRHPQIGHNVQIGSFSKVLGNLNVGDNVFIGANCLVTEDIPSNSRVNNKTGLSIEKIILNKAS